MKQQQPNTARSPAPPLPAAVQPTVSAPSSPPSQEAAAPLECLVTYADMAGREAVSQGRSAGREATNQGRNGTGVRKVAYITDSIGGNVHTKELEKLTKSNFKRAKAYGATKRNRSEGFLFPDSNFTDVVPAVLAAEQPDVVIAMAPSVELTNLPSGAGNEYASQEASCSSYNMVKVAENALLANPGLNLFVIPERIPRYNKWNERQKSILQECSFALSKMLSHILWQNALLKNALHKKSIL